MSSATIRGPWPSTMSRVLERARPHAVLIVLGVLVVGLTVSAPSFLTLRNWMNILDQNAPLMLIALGTTFVIISGGFDLSTGQLMSVAGVISVELTYRTADPGLGIALGIVSGVVLGVMNGLLAGVLRINSFLATLATGLVMGGLALYIINGESIDLTGNTTFTWLGTHRFGQVPASVLVEVLVALLLTGVLSPDSGRSTRVPGWQQRGSGTSVWNLPWQNTLVCLRRRRADRSHRRRNSAVSNWCWHDPNGCPVAHSQRDRSGRHWRYKHQRRPRGNLALLCGSFNPSAHTECLHAAEHRTPSAAGLCRRNHRYRRVFRPYNESELRSGRSSKTCGRDLRCVESLACTR